MALSFGVGSIVSTVDSDLWLSGSYPIVGLADARAAHATARAELQRGIDPMAERKAEKSAELESKRRASTEVNTDAENPFREVALLWFEKWKERKVERYTWDTESRIQEDVLSRIGNRPIAAIKPAQIAKMILAIEERGAADVARRALQAIVTHCADRASAVE